MQTADEGSPSSIESIAVGDLVYPATDVSLPTSQKLRGGGTHMTDPLLYSEEDDAQDLAQEGSPMSHGRRRKFSGYSLGHPNQATNMDDGQSINSNCSGVPDEMSTHSEEFPFHRVKLLCSYGGKIFPRPTDGLLRYVGGDTRLITVSRDISYHELMQKIKEIFSQARTIKYKLPEEDLDALVSASSDEDLANMMEEYDGLVSSETAPRLRLFLFSDVDRDSVHLNESLGDQRNSEQRYVDAVNGIPETGSRKHSGDGGLATVAPIVVDHPWIFNRPQEAVPVAMLAPQISQDVVFFIQQVPVAVLVLSIPTHLVFPSHQHSIKIDLEKI